MFIFLIINHLNIITFAITNQNLITILYQLLNSKYAFALHKIHKHFFCLIILHNFVTSKKILCLTS